MSTRDDTDAKLQDERSRADEELLDRSHALGEDADLVIRKARERAQAVLALARRREDEQVRMHGTSTHAASALAAERRLEDSAIRREHAVADHAIEVERQRRRLALTQLLALERRATDVTLDAERASADDAVRVRDDLLAQVSHDLRGMLAAASINAAVIASVPNVDEPVVISKAETIMRVTAQMGHLISDLLDIASMDSGQLRLEQTSSDVVEVVREIVDAHGEVATANEIQLSAKLPAAPVLANLDVPRLSRVLLNLVMNAIKFTPARGSVEIAVRSKEREVEICVSDTGPGIPAEDRTTIFERFRQLAGAKRSGVGLGLYIARTIVTAHGGSIRVEDAPGGGAAFHVWLPTS